VTRSVRASGPGRVNLIGEHTDYNDGLCLPFAIERGVTVEAEPLDGDRVEAHAVDMDERDAFGLRDGDALRGASGWRAFVRGVAVELRSAGHAIPGARLRFSGDVPQGSGLSSSAALETALALALLALAGERDPPDRVALARLCSRVENEWVGAETGLLDQLAALFGREGHAIRLDCRDVSIAPVPLELRGWTLVTVDSGSAHTHAKSGYNERRRECREACERLGIRSLRDATAAGAGGLPEPLAARVRHVVSENARVDETVTALNRGDLERVAELLNASHASLRDDYDASVPEVEATVAALRGAGAAGARMVGGGFGGSVLALLRPGVPPPGGAVVVAPGRAARVIR
jgi:galactokinase